MRKPIILGIFMMILIVISACTKTTTVTAPVQKQTQSIPAPQTTQPVTTTNSVHEMNKFDADKLIIDHWRELATSYYGKQVLAEVIDIPNITMLVNFENGELAHFIHGELPHFHYVGGVSWSRTYYYPAAIGVNKQFLESHQILYSILKDESFQSGTFQGNVIEAHYYPLTWGVLVNSSTIIPLSPDAIRIDAELSK
jgi:hypothetical protein